MASLGVRMGQLETRVADHGQRTRKLEITDAGRNAEVIALREDVAALTATINKLIWTVVGFTFTLAATSVAFALTAGGA